MIKPLSPGGHQVHFEGAFVSNGEVLFALNITYNLYVSLAVETASSYRGARMMVLAGDGAVNTPRISVLRTTKMSTRLPTHCNAAHRTGSRLVSDS